MHQLNITIFVLLRLMWISNEVNNFPTKINCLTFLYGLRMIKTASSHNSNLQLYNKHFDSIFIYVTANYVLCRRPLKFKILVNWTLRLKVININEYFKISQRLEHRTHLLTQTLQRALDTLSFMFYQHNLNVISRKEFIHPHSPLM